MPTDGSGNYSLPDGSTAVSGDVIEASVHNIPLADIAAGLSARVTRNGSAPMTGDLNLGANRITGLAEGTNDDHAVPLGQINEIVLDLPYLKAEDIGVDVQAWSATLDTWSMYTHPEPGDDCMFYWRESDESIQNVTIGEGISLTDGTLASLAILPEGYIYGLTLANNASDATNDIDIAAGRCRDADDQTDMVLAAALTKRLDATWSSGTNQGGLDTGTKAISTLYAVWLIKNSDSGTVDALFSTSATSPTMPADYDRKRRIGWIRTDGSGVILGFVQSPNSPERIILKAMLQDVAVTGNATTTSVSVTSNAPPKVQVILSALLTNQGTSGNGTIALVIRETGETDAVASTTVNFDILSSVSADGLAVIQSFGAASEKVVRTDASRNYNYRKTNMTGGATVRLMIRGWIDWRLP
jgi:hypothetical protein